MKVDQATMFHRSFVESEPTLNSIRAYLHSVESGNAEVYTAPFAKGVPITTVMDDWSHTLSSIQHVWPTLWEFENDLRSKVGPLSIRKPMSERMDDVEAYYEGITIPSKPLDNLAIQSVINEWKPVRGLRQRSVDHTVKVMRKSTNSGTPYFTKRRNVINDTIPFELEWDGPFVWQTFSGNNIAAKFNAPAIVGWRGQEGGLSDNDVKQRVVWMFPFAVNIAELQLYQPAIEAAQKFNLVPAWVSMDAVDECVTRMFDTKSKGDYVVCTDFTKFDQHFNYNLQNAAKEVISSFMANDTRRKELWLEDVFPIKYMIPLIYGWEKVKTGLHGMASGSGGTNFDETLAHRALQYEAAMEHQAELNRYSQCLGDDGVLTFPGANIDDIVFAYQRHGLEMNETKQYSSTEDCVYLRRWHHQEYRIDNVCSGVYSTYRAIGRLRYMERYMDPKFWDNKMVALRQLSIIENVNKHPLRNEFAEFCMKRDVYRLGIDIPGFLDDIDNYARKAMIHMPDLLGYVKTQMSKRTSLNDWWIVKFLKDNR